jgi:hypothetical protein
MALISPGVEVTVIDESQYLPAAAGTVPFILFASAQNKISGTGTGIAAGTLEVNAGKVYLITSQRDMATTFGNPFFYTTTAGTPINGYELNEYGLLAAYSVLGVSNRAFMMRANIDLAALTASLNRPLGDPAPNTYWLDTDASTFGVFEWNSTGGGGTGAFTLRTPTVISDPDLTTGPNVAPLQSVGMIGDYAIVATNTELPLYYKAGNTIPSTDSNYNEWVEVGSADWQNVWPTVQSAAVTTGVQGYLTLNGTTINSGIDTDLLDVAYGSGGNTFVAVGATVNSSTNEIYYAPAANVTGQWSVANTAGFSGNLRAVATDGTYYVAVGDNGNILVGGANTAVWSQVGNATTTFSGSFRDIAYTGSGYTAVGDSGAIFTSANAFAGFTAATANANVSTQLLGVASVGNASTQFAVGASGRMLYTSDSWSTVSNVSNASLTTNTLNAVTAFSGVTVAVGASGTVLLNSTDPGNASAWAAVTTSAIPSTKNLVDVAYSYGQFVAIAASGEVYVSTTGSTWAAGTASGLTSIAALTKGYSASSAVIVGADGGLVVGNPNATWAPNAQGATISTLAAAINAASITGITAGVVNNRLNIYGGYTAQPSGGAYGTIALGGDASMLSLLGVTAGTYNVPVTQAGPHTNPPRWTSTLTTQRPSGSIWNKTTAVNNGTLLNVSKWSTTLLQFVQQSCPLYISDAAVNNALDPAGGGKNIAAGATYAQIHPMSDTNNFTVNTTTNTITNGLIGMQLFERYAAGATNAQGVEANPDFSASTDKTFYISASVKGSNAYATPVLCTVGGTYSAEDFVTAVFSSNLDGVTAEVNAQGYIVLSHEYGGSILLQDGGVNSSVVSIAGFVPNDGAATTVTVNAKTNNYFGSAGLGGDGDVVELSNWVDGSTWALGTEIYYQPTAPDRLPDNGTYWYYSAADQVDIMIKDGGVWKGYYNVTADIRGYNLSTGLNETGPIISPTEPTTIIVNNSEIQLTDQVGQLWIDTSDLDNYPIVKRWEEVAPGDYQWVLIDNADQTSQNGILFADARWASSGTVDPVNDPIPTIESLLNSDYLDLDAPDPDLYPEGILLWNMRRSGFNVKAFTTNYFTAQNYPDQTLPTYSYTWVTASGLRDNGAMYAGRKAQRALIVQALRAAIDVSSEAREDARIFNLLACPQYPELIQNLVVLNNDRSNTAFIIGDTPMRLPATSQPLQAYATNDLAGAQVLPEDYVTTGDPYVATYYPSCQTNNTDGTTVVQPPSHMMLRTYVRSDEASYPWFAPAGTRRGVIDNAARIGYINGQTGEFTQTNMGRDLRDILYENAINPITFIPGTGITAYGQKTRYNVGSALNRVNVARLIVYLRTQLALAVQPYLFEPNDAFTRSQVLATVTTLLNDLVAKRGLYDYLAVCDESNNTPERVDRNELYVDVAVEPVKTVEFIYIPIRVKNTGEIAAGA